ncbi:uncharacterized protein LOC144657068 [Oculina patagonica]
MAFKFIFAVVILAFAVDALDVENCGGSVKFRSLIAPSRSATFRRNQRVTLRARFDGRLPAANFRLEVFVQTPGSRRFTRLSQRNLNCNQLKGMLTLQRCPSNGGRFNAKTSIVIPNRAVSCDKN